MQMTRPENDGSDFQPCPAGMQQMVLVDIKDCGWEEAFHEGRSKGFQPFIKFVWASRHLREDEKPHLVYERRMRWTFHEKATLYGYLVTLLEKPNVEHMLDSGASIESILGYNALINIVHTPREGGGVYTNIGAIAPLMEGMQPISYPDYERLHHRDGWIEPVPSAFTDAATARRILGERAGQGTLPNQPPQSQGGPQQSAHQFQQQFPGITTSAAAVAQQATPPAATPPAPVAMPTTPIPVTTPPAVAAAVEPVPAAPQFGPMSPDQMNGLIGLGTRLFGAAVTTELEARSQKLFTKSWIGLTTDEASRLTFELRNTKPIEAVAIKNAATPAATGQYDEAVYMSSPYSPFADEGEPGWRPDGHEDILKDGEVSAAIAAEVAQAQPALIPNTTQASAMMR